MGVHLSSRRVHGLVDVNDTCPEGRKWGELIGTADGRSGHTVLILPV
jgi:hypothetical protein